MPTSAKLFNNASATFRIRRVTEELAGVEALRVTRLGQQLLCVGRVVDRRRRLPIELKALRNDTVGQVRAAESDRLTDALAVHRQTGSPAYPLVMPRRLRVPLVGEVEPLRARHCRFQRQTWRLLQLVGQFATDRIGDVHLAAFQRRQPRSLVRDDPQHQAFDRWHLAPIAFEGLQHHLDPWGERDELVGPGAHRCLFEALVADLLEIFLWYDPARAGRAAVEGQEVWPRLA